ncbi:hypothetical protein SAMN05444285_13149 [Draconibacterium orientale]|uniref:Uncharacterized protein n=2 Tax=Draconibacterium orientale TaxID=1168034 RepID=X5E165_9BACT|nr:hypothetical protein FH5T_20780 [Draconibacterium orientale]SET95270.1 hypothetical protein SAMN05444285_13149 [Draconibacterium orientale]
MFQFSELLILFSFKINQDYIAKNLCIEKDIEGSTCKGCCQLEKRMHEQDEQKKELPPQQTEKQNIDFCVPLSGINFALCTIKENLAGKVATQYSFQNLFKVFHPPAGIC